MPKQLYILKRIQWLRIQTGTYWSPRLYVTLYLEELEGVWEDGEDTDESLLCSHGSK